MRAEKKGTELSRRRVGDRSPLQTQAMERARAYLEKVRELDQDKQLAPFYSALLDQAQGSSAQIRQFAGQQFPDVFQQYLALVYVRDRLRELRKRRKAPFLDNLLANVDAALDALLTEDGVEIAAGFNIAPISAAHAGPLGSPNQLRHLYRDAVLDYGNLSDTYQKILDEYGTEHYSESVTYLVKALGADLAAEGPSLPKERLRMIIEDLYKLQSLESLDDECSEFLAQLQRLYRQHTLPEKCELIGQLLALLEQQWIGASQLKSVTEALKVGEDMAIYFLQGFKELVRLIPLKVYNDPFEREKLMSALQAYLDQIIDNEEDRMETQS